VSTTKVSCRHRHEMFPLHSLSAFLTHIKRRQYFTTVGEASVSSHPAVASCFDC